MRRDNLHLGYAELLSGDKLTAGMPSTIHIVYTVGRYGLDENAGIRLAWRSVSDWEQPQFKEPDAYGFSTVSTTGSAKLVPSMSPYQRPFHNSLVIKVREAPLFEGDKIDIILGDTSQGSPGLRTQSFAESAHEIKVLVDPFNTNRYEPLPQSIHIGVTSSPANEIQLVAPSRVVPGEDFEMTVRVLDEWGNPCTDFTGDVNVGVLSGQAEVVSRVHLEPADRGFKRFGGNRLSQMDTVYFWAECPKEKLYTVSNACTGQAQSEYRLYWGDIHGQTDFTVGTGSLDEYFQFAQGPAALDVSGWQGNDLEVTPKKWEEVKRVTKKYNHPGRSITFLGYEWSGNFPGGGDHNVYFLHDDGELHPSSHWSTDADFDENSRCDRYPINELFDTFRGRKDVMIVPHIGGRPANLDYYDPEFIPNIEIHSHHGTFEWFAHDAMRRGLKVGFVASSDDHTCRLGLSYALQNTGQAANAFDTKSGLVAIYAKELTREAIWEALKARRCYAVTFGRIDLQTHIGTLMMGQEGSCTEPPTVEVAVKGTAPLDHIEFFRNNDCIYRWVPEQKPCIDGRKRVKILWSGVRNTGRSKSAKWDGTLYIDAGKICGVTERAFDTFQQGVTTRSNQIVSWKSSTSGDIDGLILDIEAPEQAVLHFTSKLKCFQVALGDLSTEPMVFPAGGENLKVEVSLTGTDMEQWNTETYCAQMSFCDKEAEYGQHAYWVKAVQQDGQMAFSSPIFIEYQK